MRPFTVMENIFTSKIFITLFISKYFEDYSTKSNGHSNHDRTL